MASDTDVGSADAAAPKKRKRFVLKKKPKGRSAVTNGNALFIANPNAARLTRRFVDLLNGTDDPDQQIEQLRRRYSALCLAAEQLEACAARGEPYDMGLLATITGSITRLQDRINEPRPVVTDKEEEAAAADRAAYLGTLDEAALLALREQVSPPAPPRPVPTHDIEVATREHEARVSAQRARTHTVHRPTSSNKKSASDKQERADQGQGAPTFDVTQSLIEVLS